MLPLLLALSLTSQTIDLPAGRPIEEQPAARVLVVLRPSEALPTPVAAITHEIQRLWKAARVEFQWASKLPSGEPIVDRIITVHVTDDPGFNWQIPPGALGGVPIVANRMRQLIYVSPAAVKRLVALAGISPSDGQHASFYARPVGRVVAHELGHLLLHSVAHRSSGLMRRSFVARDVVSGDGSRFALGSDDVRALEQRLADARKANAPMELTPIVELIAARPR